MVFITLYDESTGDTIEDYETSCSKLSQLAEELVSSGAYEAGHFYFASETAILPGKTKIANGDAYTIVNHGPITVVLAIDGYDDTEAQYQLDTTIKQIQGDIALSTDKHPNDISISFSGRVCAPNEVIGNLGISDNSRITANVQHLHELSFTGDIIRTPFTTTFEASITFAEVHAKLITDLSLSGLEAVLQYKGLTIQTNTTVGQFFEDHPDIVGTPVFELKPIIMGDPLVLSDVEFDMEHKEKLGTGTFGTTYKVMWREREENTTV